MSCLLGLVHVLSLLLLPSLAGPVSPRILRGSEGDSLRGGQVTLKLDMQTGFGTVIHFTLSGYCVVWAEGWTGSACLVSAENEAASPSSPRTTSMGAR